MFNSKERVLCGKRGVPPIVGRDYHVLVSVACLGRSSSWGLVGNEISRASMRVVVDILDTRDPLQLFLTDGALHLLVVDLYKFHRDPSRRGDAVYIWLDALLCRVPGCAVLIVATHADDFGDDRDGVAAALAELRVVVEEHLDTKRAEWEAENVAMQRNAQDQGLSGDWTASAPSLILCGIIEASGCRSQDLIALQVEVSRLASEEGISPDGTRLFPNIGQPIPVLWARVWAATDALHEGADPIAAAALTGKPRVSVDGHEQPNFVTWEVALEMWSKVVRALGLSAEIGEQKQGEERVLKVRLF